MTFNTDGHLPSACRSLMTRPPTAVDIDLVSLVASSTTSPVVMTTIIEMTITVAMTLWTVWWECQVCSFAQVLGLRLKTETIAWEHRPLAPAWSLCLDQSRYGRARTQEAAPPPPRLERCSQVV